MRYPRLLAFVLLTFAVSVSSLAQQPTLSRNQQQIVDKVKAIFVAAQTDDFAKFNSLVLPGFYMYDGGKRFDGDAILKLISDLHRKGFRYDWNVTDTDVHIEGKTAWVAYVNRGSVTDPQGKVMEMRWLESAFLEKHDGVWKIAFFHSTRAPETQAGK
ncbi:MAG TPA: nuclear transport factor 2 family protein [Terracidiphilus sp.]|nr:nuclear transport factor 2 family protein [Terracidiphilus sp.]